VVDPADVDSHLDEPLIRLLIVEDEPIVQQLLLEVLRGEADELLIAGGLAEARVHARAGFTVALVDKNLPDGSGLALISELRAMQPDGIVVMMTAYASLDTAIEALRAGAHDYIQKPFRSMQDLVLKVRRAREQVELVRRQATLSRRIGENEARFRGLFEASADAVVVHDAATGIIHEANPAACALYGLARDALIGRDVTTLHGSVGPGAQRVDRHADGTALPVEVSRAPFAWQNASLIVEIVHDRRDQLRAEAERVALTEQLHRAVRMESLGRMAGGIAHDFNNTLAVISGSAQLLARELPSTVSAQCFEDLATIDAAAHSAATLIKQLLTFARREPARSDLLDLNAVISGLDRLLRGALGSGHALVVAPAAGPCLLMADRGQLEQVLTNLVINARDALGGPGQITIATATDGALVELTVTDTGCGIPPEIMPRIFEPFFTTKASQGTGLGLATVFGVVEGLGGTITVTSQPGATTFRVGFAAAAPVPVPDTVSTEPFEPFASAVSRRQVLVAEDDVLVRNLVCRMLDRGGFQSHPAVDGAAALALARELPRLDLLLTDVSMPHVSGGELARALHEDRPDLPVIFMSAAPPPGQPIRSPDRFLAKPFSESELLGLVRGMTRARP